MMGTTKWSRRDLLALTDAFAFADTGNRLRILFAGAVDKNALRIVIDKAVAAFAGEVEAHCVLSGARELAEPVLDKSDDIPVRLYSGRLDSVIASESAFDIVFLCLSGRESLDNLHWAAPLLAHGGVAVLPVNWDAPFWREQNKDMHGKFRFIGANRLLASGDRGCVFFRRQSGDSAAASRESLLSALADDNMPILSEDVRGRVVVSGRQDDREIALRLNTIGVAVFERLTVGLRDAEDRFALMPSPGKDACRPLSPLSPWHAFLAVGSGICEGVLISTDGVKTLVKGQVRRRTEERNRIVKAKRSNGRNVTVTERERMFIPAVEIVCVEMTGVNRGRVRHVF